MAVRHAETPRRKSLLAPRRADQSVWRAKGEAKREGGLADKNDSDVAAVGAVIVGVLAVVWRAFLLSARGECISNDGLK